MIDVKIKIIKILGNSFNALIPEYQTIESSGCDLVACLDYSIAIPPGKTIRVPTGCCLEIPRGFEGQVRPRSGLSAKGIFAILGTIDSDYRGEILVVMYNSTDSCFMINPGDRIAQLIFSPTVQAYFTKSLELSSTERGTGGFGSTGV